MDNNKRQEHAEILTQRLTVQDILDDTAAALANGSNVSFKIAPVIDDIVMKDDIIVLKDNLTHWFLDNLNNVLKERIADAFNDLVKEMNSVGCVNNETVE